MSIAFVDSYGQTIAESTVPYEVPLTIPATASVGDLAVAVVANGQAAALTGPTGWTEQIPQQATTSMEAGVWIKRLVTGDPGSVVNWAMPAGGKAGGIVVVYSGVGSVSAGAEYALSTAGTTIVAPVIGSSDAVVEFAATKGSPPVAWTAPGTLTSRGSVVDASTGGVSLGAADILTTATGGDTWTLPSSLNQRQVFTLGLTATVAASQIVVTDTSQVLIDATGSIGAGLTYAIAQTSGPTAAPAEIGAGLWLVNGPSSGGDAVYTVSVTDSNNVTSSQEVTVPAAPAWSLRYYDGSTVHTM